MELFGKIFSLVVAGLVSGSLYALLALAIVLIYQSTSVVNFAQGEVALLCAFLIWKLSQIMPLWCAVPIVLVFSFVLGQIIEFVFLRRLESWQQLNAIVLTIGLAMVVNNLVIFWFGATPQSFPTLFPEGALDFHYVTISYQSLGILVVGAVLGLGLYIFLSQTRLGIALRATSQNWNAAKLMGVSIGSMFGIGWGLAGVLGTVTGIFVAPTYFLNPAMMQSVMVYGFVSATVGGLESPIGAVVGGLLVGVLESLAGGWEPIGSELKLVVTLFVLIIVLLVRPQGIWGVQRTRKV